MQEDRKVLMKYESEEESGCCGQVSKGGGVLAPAGKRKDRAIFRSRQKASGAEEQGLERKCSCHKDFNPGSPQGCQETCQRERSSR